MKRVRGALRGVPGVFMALLCVLALQPGAVAEGTDPGIQPLGDVSRMGDIARWGELNTHDPAILLDNGKYYVFSTDASYGDMHTPGIQVRVSDDLIRWEYLGPAFANYAEDCAEAIAYAGLDVGKKQGLWAPDVIKVGDTYRMYFSASTFGSSRSCIGLAEADRPEGPYTYRGIVVRSYVNAVSGPNAIDPAIVTDAEGGQWMSYGSFSGGIFLEKLDVQTGLIGDASVQPVRIAGSRGAAIEGSCILYWPENGYYYLFVSCGSLSSNYTVRVGRSREIAGPYLDANGKNLAAIGPGYSSTIGVKLMGGFTFLSDPGALRSKGTMAPGHNSVLAQGGDLFMVHHARTYALPDYWFTMNVRRMFINRFDWPVLAPNRYTGEALVPIELPEGDYALVRHGDDTNTESRDSARIELREGTVSGAVSGTYGLYGDYRITLTLEGVEYDGFVLRQYDWERRTEVLSFTAMSESGLCIWGCTQL